MAIGENVGERSNENSGCNLEYYDYPQFHIEVADSHRLVDRNGKNVQWNGCTAWMLLTALSLTEAKTYIDNRVAKNVNAMIIEAPGIYFGANVPLNDNLDAPFSSTIAGGAYDWTDPNQAYWDHFEEILKYCFQKRIWVFVWPAYIGINLGAEGWASEMADNGVAAMTTYGTYIGNIIKKYPNIVIVHGGDNPPSTINSEIQAIANAIKVVAPHHLHTAHDIRYTSAMDNYSSIIDFNSTYENKDTLSTAIRVDYQRVGALPTFLVEGSYVNSGMTDIESMRQAYQTILSGGIGHFLGAFPEWYFGSGWDTNIDVDGAQYLEYIGRLQAARDLPSLSPDYSDTFVTAGKGTEGASYSPVLASSSQLVAFCNNGANLTVDRSQFTGSINVRWFDPTDGSTRTETGSPFTNSGSTTFNSSGDEILLIDLVSLGLGLP